MARIHEEIVLIKMSKLVRDAGEVRLKLPEGFIDGIEAVVGDLIADPTVIVEVVGPDVADDT